MKNLFLLSIGLILITACNSKNENTTDTPSNWESYATDNLSIQYPNDWTLTHNGEMGTLFIIKSELTSTKDDFSENINLVTEDISTFEVTLDMYADVSVTNIERMVEGVEMITNTRIKGEDKDFHKLVYSSNQNGYLLVYEQYLWVTNSTAYVLTFVGKKGEYEAFKEIAEKIMDSFRIK